MNVRFVLASLLLLLISAPVAALDIQLQSVETDCGVPVTVAVVIRDQPENLRSVTWRLEYDPSKLRFEGFEVDPDGVLPEYWPETTVIGPGSVRVSVFAGGTQVVANGIVGTAAFALTTPAAGAVVVQALDVQFVKGFQGVPEPGTGRPATIDVSCPADDRGRPQVYRYSPFAGSTGGGGFADGFGSDARFIAPFGVARVGDDMFVTDSGAHVVRRMAPDGTVTTWAGAPGVPGNDEGPGMAARFDRPEGILALPDGSLLVADRGNSKVRRIGPDGVVSTWAGTGAPAHRDGSRLQSQFAAPSSLALEPAGSILIGDPGTCTIRRVTGDSLRTIAGQPGICGTKNGLLREATFEGMSGILAHPTLGILVADDINHVVRRIVAEQSVLTWAGVAGEPGTADGILGAGRLTSPRSLVLMADESVLIATANGIRQVSGNSIRTIAGGSSRGWADGNGSAARMDGVAGLALSGSTIVASELGNTTIRRVSATFDVTTAAGTANLRGFRDDAGPAARFNRPWQVATDAAGNVYVADRGNRCIRRITPDGITSVWAGRPGVAGGDNGPRLSATFDDPTGLAVDASGNIWVSEAATHVIRVIRPDGRVETAAGLRGASGFLDGREATARFSSPMQLAADAKGNVYVADRGNHAIRRITANGTVVTEAGVTGTPGNDDGPIEDAKFNEPVAVAVSPTGSVFVADKGNDAIREVRNGVVFTVLALKNVPGRSDGPSLGGQLLSPEGLALLPDGALLVAEPNGRIRRVTTRHISTLVGRFGVQGNLGGLGSEALLASPVSVAVLGEGRFVVSDAENNALIRSVRCADDSLCLAARRFALSLRATDPRTGNEAEGLPITESDIFGFFSLPGLTGNAANPEVFVKMLDGTGVNGKYWVFYGGLTDLELDLSVRDRVTGTTKSYSKPGFDFCGGADTNAFGKGIASLPVRAVRADVVAPSSEAGPCDEDSLCLRSGRFQARLSATDPRTGATADGVPIPRTGDFGYFSLPGLTGNAANPEVFIKVLDGRGVNGRYWVFYGGLTDFEFTLEVTDTEQGITRTYVKPGLEFCGGADTSAF